MADVELLPAYEPDDALEDRLAHPSVKALHVYWRGKAGPGRLPGRGDLDPLDMKPALGNMVMIDVHRAPLRFRYRLHGASLVLRDGFDMTGKWLEEHPEPELRARIQSSWSRAAEQRKIVHGFRDCFADLRRRRYEVLILPLADDGRTVDKLLVLQIHLDR